jgi:hypothetical protein
VSKNGLKAVKEKSQVLDRIQMTRKYTSQKQPRLVGLEIVGLERKLLDRGKWRSQQKMKRLRHGDRQNGGYLW